ncbi:MAG: hypothetical protein HWD61_02095 [Parachlamydiaceae bacterium]|nr:MAG: hypothetical protein HWD61_02095 [Parachlamydiaceae bacterium]
MVVLTGIAALGIGMTLLMTAPLALPVIALAVAMKVAGYLSSIGGIAAFSTGLVYNFNLSQLSRAYAYQSRTAQQFIWDLKTQDAVRI